MNNILVTFLLTFCFAGSYASHLFIQQVFHRDHLDKHKLSDLQSAIQDEWNYLEKSDISHMSHYISCVNLTQGSNIMKSLQSTSGSSVHVAYIDHENEELCLLIHASGSSFKELKEKFK